MSRQIQIRRGTAAENDNFTGAIGEITMDTTNKTLRIHDGETLGGTILAKKSEISEIANADYVVETQLPTAENNYTWYRKYKSGWVEMGGSYGGSQNQVISLPLEMADNNYSVMLSFNTTSINAPVYSSYAYDNRTTVSFKVINSGSIYGMWEVKGLSA